MSLYLKTATYMYVCISFLGDLLNIQFVERTVRQPSNVLLSVDVLLVIVSNITMPKRNYC